MVPAWRAHTVAPLTLVVVALVVLLLLAPKTPPAISSELLVRDVWQRGFTRAHPELCPSRGTGLRLLVLVATAPAHAKHRDAVRLTWGHNLTRYGVAIAFMLGAVSKHLERSLSTEDTLHGDLITGRSLDTYSNLTLKTLSMLEWTATYCPRVPFLLKVDDDVFVNIKGLLHWALAPARANATRTIWGKLCRRVRPNRTTTVPLYTQYYVPLSQFPESMYPYYVNGLAYVLTADCVRPLLEAAPNARYLRLEDVFVTGVLAMRLELVRRHDLRFFYSRDKFAKRCNVRRAVAMHGMLYHEQFEFWRWLHDDLPDNCSYYENGLSTVDDTWTTVPAINVHTPCKNGSVPKKTIQQQSSRCTNCLETGDSIDWRDGGVMVPTWRRRTVAPLTLVVVALVVLLLLAPKTPPTITSELLVRNVWQRGFTRAHPELCPGRGAGLRLLVLIATAPEHAKLRDAVRLTWGHNLTRYGVAIAFMLGAVSEHLEPSLATEDTLHGDLITGRNLDTYSNLTLKTLSMLEWTATYCPSVPFLLKVDDDVFVNIKGLLRWALAPARANAARTIWGNVFRRVRPNRSTIVKYYVPLSQFPEFMFPYYVNGPAYVLTADCVRPLLEAAPNARYLRLEDVFVTGVLAMRLEIARRHDVRFFSSLDKFAKRCNVRRAVAIHGMLYHEQFEFWRLLHDDLPDNCSYYEHGLSTVDDTWTTVPAFMC